MLSSGTASNEVWFAPAATSSFSEGATMTKAASGTATSILAPATEGAYKLYVIDNYGNVSAESTAILTVDDTAPVISSVVIDSGTYKIGSVINVTINADGPGYTAGAITINGQSLGSFDNPSGNTYTGTYTVIAGDTDRASVGAIPISVILTDLAGNSNAAYTDPPTASSPSPSTTVLHPTSQGDYTAWTTAGTTGCTEDSGEWDCMNDQAGNAATGTATAHDDGAMYLLTTTDTAESSFNVDYSAIPAGTTVTQLVVSAYVREEANAGPNVEIISFYRHNASDSDCASSHSTGNTSFELYSCTFGSLSIDTDAITELEIGLHSVANDPAATQIYVEVTHQPSSGVTIDANAPSGLGSFTVDSTTDTSADLSWDAVTETNWSSTAHYEIWFGTDQNDVQNRTGTAAEWDGNDDAAMDTKATTSTTVTGLTTDATYYFQIWAIDDYGNEATVSDISSVISLSFDDIAIGNWNVGTTWNQTACASSCTAGFDYPGPGDTAIINSHTVTMTADEGVGNFTLATNGTFVDGGFTLNVTGDFARTGTGTYTATGTVMMTSTGAQNITSNGVALNNLTLNDGLVGYWKLDETSFDSCVGGADACDSSGYNRHGTNTLDPTISINTAPVKFSNVRSAQFDGSQQHRIDAGGASDFNNLNKYTYAIWVYLTGYDNDNLDGEAMLMHKNGGKSLTHILGDIKSMVATDGIYREALSNETLPLNEWAHVAATYDSAASPKLKIYLKGVEVTYATQEDGTGNDLDDSGSLYIGAHSNEYVLNLNGNVDDVRAYNRVLSAAEIQRLANGLQPGTGVGTYTFVTDPNINGDLTINSGTLDTGTANANVAGSWLNHGGIFVPGARKVTFDGTGGPHSILSGNQAFDDFKISSSTGTWTLEQDIRIAEGLHVSGGTLDLNSYDALVKLELIVDAGTLDLGSGITSVYRNVNLTGGAIAASPSTLVLVPDGARNLTAAGEALNDVVVSSNDSLVGWWKLDETSAGSFTDSSVNTNTGAGQGNTVPNVTPQPSTNTATVNFTNARSLDFDGVDDYVNVTDHSSLDVTNEFTIAAWVYSRDLSTNPNYPIVSKSDADVGIRNGYMMYFNTGGSLKLIVGDASSNDSSNVAAVIPENEWTHVAATYSFGEVELYENGSNTVSDTLSVTPTAGSNDLRIGGSAITNFGTMQFDGLMDDIRIYDRALMANEIEALAGGHPMDTSGTITLQDDLTVNGDIIFGDGTFNVAAGPRTINVGKNWIMGDATVDLVTNQAVVDFNVDGNNNTIQGSNTFYNLNLTSTPAKSLTIDSGSVQTIASGGVMTIQGSASGDVTVNSSDGSTQWDVHFTDTHSTDKFAYVNLNNSGCDAGTAVADMYGTGNSNTANNDTSCWNFTPPNVTISGSAYQTNESTKLGTQTIKMAVGAGTSYTDTMSGGDFSFDSVTTPADGTIITMWIDGATEKGSLVFRYGSACTGYPNSCTGLSIFQDRVILDTKDGTALTNAMLAACDNDTGTECGATPDTDIGFTSETNNLTLTFNGAVLRLKDATADYAPTGDINAVHFNMTAGTFTGGAGAHNFVTDGSFTLSGGNFTATSGTMTVEKNLTISGSPVFAHGSGTIDITGSTSTDDSVLACNNVTFNLITLNASSYLADLTVGSDCDIPLGNSPTSGVGNIINNGDITVGTGTWTMSVAGSGYTQNAGATLTNNATTWIAGNITLNDGTLTANNLTTIDSSGAVVLGGGVFTVPALTTISVERNLTNSANLLPNGLDLTLDGTASSDDGTLTCGTATFNSVAINKSGAGDITIQSDCTDIPLGNDPSTAGIIINHGTITVGTGTWTHNGTYVSNAGATLASSGTTIVLTGLGNLTLNDGVMPAGITTIDMEGSLALNGGTFSSGLTTLSVERNLTNTGTILPNGVDVTLDGTTTSDDTTLNCAGSTLGSLTINKTVSTATTDLGANCTVTGDLTRTDGVINDPASAYMLSVEGNFVMSTADAFGGANLTLEFGGGNPQNFTQNAGAAVISSPVDINKDAQGDTVTLLTDMTLTFHF